MAEVTDQCDERRDEQTQPSPGRLELKPQRRSAERRAKPEQVIDEAPEETAIIEKRHAQQRPEAPSPGDAPIEPYGAADEERKDRDEKKLAREFKRHDLREKRHEDIARQARQRRP